MILTKNGKIQKQLSEILKAVVGHLAAAGEVLTTGRIIRDNDKTEKDVSET